MKYDHDILLLQGGGALGAYQAGVYEGLVEAGVEPSWVVGISIGAINAALIVGNPPERRVQRLREFWQQISVNAGPPLPAWLDLLRPAVNYMAAMSAATIGVAGFYRPSNATSVVRRGRHRGRPERVRHSSAQGHSRRASGFRFDQSRAGSAFSGCRECMQGHLHLFRYQKYPHPLGPYPSQWRSAAWLPAGDDRRGTLLGRRRGYQYANQLCGGRKTIDNRPHHCGRHLQRSRTTTAKSRPGGTRRASGGGGGRENAVLERRRCQAQ